MVQELHVEEGPDRCVSEFVCLPFLLSRGFLKALGEVGWEYG